MFLKMSQSKTFLAFKIFLYKSKYMLRLVSLKSDAQCKMKNGNSRFSLGDVKFAFLFILNRFHL